MSPCYWNDDFSGTLTTKWVDISSGVGSASIVGGKLRLDNGTTGISGQGAVELKATVTGDFDIQVKVTGVTHPAATGWYASLHFQIDSTHYLYASLWESSTSKYYLRGYKNGGSELTNYVFRSFDSGFLRLVRTGTSVQAYYCDGATFFVWSTLNTAQSIGSGDGVLRLRVVKWTNNPQAVCDFDDFTVSSGCPAEPAPGVTIPTVETDTCTEVTSSAAKLNGNVTSAGGGTISQRGFAYSSVSTVPTISDSLVTVSGTLGEFSSTITTLGESTTYYVRAFATNESGTGYGAVEQFTTAATEETHTDSDTGSLPDTSTVNNPNIPNPKQWSGIIEIIRHYLRDPNGSIFTGPELLQYYNDASFEVGVKSGPVVRVEAHYFPPEYDSSYMWDWESDFGEGTQYQCLTINQADGWVVCFPWESAYWLDTEPSGDDGYRDFHPWEMCLGSPADVIRMPLHKKFHKMLYCAFDELTLDPIDEMRLSEQDAYYRTRTGQAVNYYRKDEVQNEIVIYPLPSNIWDETEVYEVLGDAGGMISDESWLDLRDEGITYDVIPTDGMLFMVYEAMPDELEGWEDIPDLPPYLIKYVRYGTLERAYGADTDAFIPSLRDYWALRKKIGIEAIKKWKRLSKINRDYRLGGAVSRVQSRHPRLPSHYPQVT